MSTISVDVQHRAGDFELIARFDVPDAGITVLSGPSGAGKSLTLALLAGLRRPDRGHIRVGGRLLDDVAAGHHVAPQRRGTGVVFQDALLLPHRSALDNVALAVRARRRGERRRLAGQALADVGAAPLAAARPRTLSGGERRRVALARALAGRPGLLLLDEPFSALDAPVRADLRALVRRVVDERGIPALLVTHDDDDVAALADHVVRFERGGTHRAAAAHDGPGAGGPAGGAAM